jgi:hypothetical protein
MQLTTQQYHKYWKEKSDPKIASIVLTSEAASVLSRRHNYTTSPEFPFRFVWNQNDVAQGHGEPNRFNESAHGPAKIMISTLVAIKMQLMAKYTVANCCSAFHRVMVDLLRAGCGAVAEPDFRCLQEVDDPQYRLCCVWEADKRCVMAMKEFQETFQNRMSEFS